MSLRSDVELLVGDHNLAVIELVSTRNMSTVTGEKLRAFLKAIAGRMFSAEMASYSLRERIRVLEAEVDGQRAVIERLTEDLT